MRFVSKSFVVCQDQNVNQMIGIGRLNEIIGSSMVVRREESRENILVSFSSFQLNGEQDEGKRNGAGDHFVTKVDEITEEKKSN